MKVLSNLHQILGLDDALFPKRSHGAGQSSKQSKKQNNHHQKQAHYHSQPYQPSSKHQAPSVVTQSYPISDRDSRSSAYQNSYVYAPYYAPYMSPGSVQYPIAYQP